MRACLRVLLDSLCRGCGLRVCVCVFIGGEKKKTRKKKKNRNDLPFCFFNRFIVRARSILIFLPFLILFVQK